MASCGYLINYGEIRLVRIRLPFGPSVLVLRNLVLSKEAQKEFIRTVLLLSGLLSSITRHNMSNIKCLTMYIWLNTYMKLNTYIWLLLSYIYIKCSRSREIQLPRFLLPISESTSSILFTLEPFKDF